jgi:hypothetical protein
MKEEQSVARTEMGFGQDETVFSHGCGDESQGVRVGQKGVN